LVSIRDTIRVDKLLLDRSVSILGLDASTAPVVGAGYHLVLVRSFDIRSEHFALRLGDVCRPHADSDPAAHSSLWLLT